jgi:hypothetical protein
MRTEMTSSQVRHGGYQPGWSDKKVQDPIWKPCGDVSKATIPVEGTALHDRPAKPMPNLLEQDKEGGWGNYLESSSSGEEKANIELQFTSSLLNIMAFFQFALGMASV